MKLSPKLNATSSEYLWYKQYITQKIVNYHIGEPRLLIDY